MVGPPRAPTTASGPPCAPHASVQQHGLSGDLEASVSFSDIQTDEARSGEDRDRLDDQMEKDAIWIVIYRFPSYAWHPWIKGRRESRHEQREEMEKQFLCMVSSARRRVLRGCLVLVEGT